MEIRQIKTDEASYAFVEQLLHDAFPPEERRDTPQQRAYTDQHPLFHCCLISENGSNVGLITYWQFDDFYYIEHFAIDPTLRNGGYGKRALESIEQLLNKPIVLEVEAPTDELSTRRIGFYRRLGFTLCEHPYLQPPYRPGDGELPMFLMTYGDIDMNKEFERVRDAIHREVYGVIR